MVDNNGNSKDIQKEMESIKEKIWRYKEQIEENTENLNELQNRFNLEFGKCHIVTWLLNRIPVYFGEIRYRHRKYSVSAYLNKAVTAMTTTALFS